MGAGARESNVPQNQFTQQSAASGYHSVQDFGSMGNYPLAANQAFTPDVYNANLFSPNIYNPQDTVNWGNMMSQEGAAFLPAVAQDLQMAFDPNGAQFAYYDQKLTDAMRAANGAAGIGTTPWGAAVETQGQADFINQWAMMEAQKANAGLSAASGALGQAGALEGGGQQLAMMAPAMQSTELAQLLSALEQNYSFPQANVNNQLGYMGAANAQNQTAVASAAQAAQAAQMNSPFAFLGALGGTAGGGFMSGFGNAAGKAAFAGL